MTKKQKLDPEKYNQLLAIAVRARRKELGLTQEKLGELAGVHRTHVGFIEQSSRNTTIETLCRIANALKLTPSEILSLAESNNKG